ncbi:MAG: acyl-CoA thioesterase [Bacteroidales bacterium]
MKTSLQLRFGDIDRLGHVNNAVYAQFFDIGRIHYLKACLPALDFENKTLVLVHLDIDFIHPTFVNDSIFVETLVEQVGRRSLRMKQEIIEENAGIKVRCSSVLSTFDMKTATSFPMPEEWIKKLSLPL